MLASRSIKRYSVGSWAQIEPVLQQLTIKLWLSTSADKSKAVCWILTCLVTPHYQEINQIYGISYKSQSTEPLTESPTKVSTSFIEKPMTELKKYKALHKNSPLPRIFISASPMKSYHQINSIWNYVRGHVKKPILLNINPTALKDIFSTCAKVSIIE